MNILLVAPDRKTLSERLHGMDSSSECFVISRIIRSETDLHSIRGLRFNAIFGLETIDPQFHPQIRMRVYPR
jgi:hypothetical protein